MRRLARRLFTFCSIPSVRTGGAASASGAPDAAPALAIAKGAISMMRLAKFKLVDGGSAAAVVVGIATVVTLSAAVGRAADRTPAAGRAAPTARAASEKPSVPPAADQAGPVAAHDLLAVSLPSFTPNPGRVALLERVDEDGRVTLPAVPAVEVKGKTLAEAKASIDKAYAEVGIFAKAEATVTRVETAAAPSVPPGKIAKGEHLEFRIWNLMPNQETKAILTVDAKGEVAVPELGAVEVAGGSEASAERAIVKAYERKGLLAHAWLTVRRISEDESRRLPPGDDGAGL
jgi:protein involved in polysaccharide export with SLBB domain